jgi:hypothetical protein
MALFHVTYVIIRSIDEFVILSPRHGFQLQVLYSNEWNGMMITSGDFIRVLKKSAFPYVKAWQRGRSSEY